MTQDLDSPRIPTGIAPLDERGAGLESSGSYLVVGTPGPAKMVAAMQFVFAGLGRGEPGLIVTNAERDDFLEVAEAWGFDFRPYWRSGDFRLVGFREDFELRAVRSVEPEDVLEELRTLVGETPERIAVDPGSLFLVGGVRSRLGAAYLRWARDHAATVLTTFPVEGSGADLPSTADWMLQATDGRIEFVSRSSELFEVSIVPTIPRAGEGVVDVSVELRPAEGLVEPDERPGRRADDRREPDGSRLLLVSLTPGAGGDVEAWADRAFDLDVVDEAFEAVSKLQTGDGYGGVLIRAPRRQVRQAVAACRALRPLTRGAIVFVTDDAIRSTDRVALLEAGADDCLSGGVDVRELDLRLRQILESGARSPSAGRPKAQDTTPGGRVSEGAFVAEFERRSGHPTLSFFCVVEVDVPDVAASDLVETVGREIRDEDGDLVTCIEERCLVLLQGAREGRLSGFTDRLRTAVAEATGVAADEAVRLEVMSHPSESERIRSVLGR